MTGFLGEPAPAELPRYAEFTDHINPDATTFTRHHVDAVHSLSGAQAERSGSAPRSATWRAPSAPPGPGVDAISTGNPDLVRAALLRPGSGTGRCALPAADRTVAV